MTSNNLFSTLDENLREMNQSNSVNFMTLVILLYEKGIIDDDDFNRAQAQARHIVEQEFAKKRDEGDS